MDQNASAHMVPDQLVLLCRREVVEGIEQGHRSSARCVCSERIHRHTMPGHVRGQVTARCGETIGEREVHVCERSLPRQEADRTTLPGTQVGHRVGVTMPKGLGDVRDHRVIDPEAFHQPADELHLHSTEHRREAGQVLEFDPMGHELRYFGLSMHNDTTILGVLGAAVALLTLAMDRLDRSGRWPQWLSRKVLHVGAVGTCAIAPMLLNDLGTLTLVVLVAEVVLLVAVASGRLFRESSGRPGWGIALFPLPYLALLLLFPTPHHRWLIALPMAVLALSDAAAAVVGIRVQSASYRLTADRKSIAGSAAFAFTTTGLLLLWPSPLNAWPVLHLLTAAVLLSVLLAATEALGSSGWDNVWVPAGSAAMLVALQYGDALQHLRAAWITVCIAMPFAWLSVRNGWLTLGGAVSAALLGCTVVWAQGPQWTIPLVLFFASSTLLGKIARTSRATSDAKHGRPRDAEQVWSNGGAYLAASLLLPDEQARFAMAISMAVATADTWASEIGMAVRGRTLDLRSGRLVAPGLSGGISLAGTLGAVAGAVVLAIAAASLFRGNLVTVGVIAAWGVAGMIIDSVLGAWLQVRFQVREGAWRDQALGNVLARRGFAWITNDRVNLISIALITTLALIVYKNGWSS